jgi:hypothetical protein
MREIFLTRNQVALIDDDDYEWLMRWKWHVAKGGNTFYAVRQIHLVNGKRGTVLMHRQILGLEEGDNREADHVNHYGLDNRSVNLRVVTHQQNSFNLIPQ